jgi:hypothetical protein
MSHVAFVKKNYYILKYSSKMKKEFKKKEGIESRNLGSNPGVKMFQDDSTPGKLGSEYYTQNVIEKKGDITLQIVRLKNWTWWLTPVVLTTQEPEIRRIIVCSQPRQKVCKTPPISTNKKLIQWHSPVILAIQESTNKDHGPDWPGHKHKSLFQIYQNQKGLEV